MNNESTQLKRTYGWKRELPDQRDVPFLPTVAHLPTKVSLRDGMPAVYDQSTLGACTAHALAAQLDYMRHKQGEPFMTPSRLFIYYNERAAEGTVGTDSGAMGRDGIKSMKKQGVCRESLWPYDIVKFAATPPAKCYSDALQFQVLTYKRVDHTSLSALKTALAQGLPVSFGFTVYESFEGEEVAKTGVVPMPSPREQVLGGHEVLLVGYDDEKQMAEVRNSWGETWGDLGYFWMPYKFLTSKLCSDFWVIESVE